MGKESISSNRQTNNSGFRFICDEFRQIERTYTALIVLQKCNRLHLSPLIGTFGQIDDKTNLKGIQKNRDAGHPLAESAACYECVPEKWAKSCGFSECRYFPRHRHPKLRLKRPAKKMHGHPRSH